MVQKCINLIVGPKLEPLIEQCLSSWNTLIKYDFEIKIWNDDTINIFIRENYPFALDAVLNARNHAEAADIARYLIIYHYGGYYVDWDIELVNDLKFVSLIKKLPSGFLIIDPLNGTLASECFSAKKKDPFLLSLVKDIIDIYNDDKRKLFKTPQYSGPYRMRDSLVRHLNASQKIISVKEIFRYDYSEIRYKNQIFNRHQPLVHYWMHSWIK